MKLFENKIGRPSNELKDNRKVFVISIITLVVVLLTAGIVALVNVKSENLKGTVETDGVIANKLKLGTCKISIDTLALTGSWECDPKSTATSYRIIGKTNVTSIKGSKGTIKLPTSLENGIKYTFSLKYKYESGTKKGKPVYKSKVINKEFTYKFASKINTVPAAEGVVLSWLTNGKASSYTVYLYSGKEERIAGIVPSQAKKGSAYIKNLKSNTNYKACVKFKYGKKQEVKCSGFKTEK